MSIASLPAPMPRRRFSNALILPGIACCIGLLSGPSAQTALRVDADALLDHEALLKRNRFLDNRDWQWYSDNIPFFDSPDEEINAAYYYRWQLVTKHLVYGSPSTGYTYTEFMDRPGWSGTYGAISCAAGHHLNEVRWLRDRRYAEDYARYWFHTPGAEPRRYSTWLADAVWSVYQVQNSPEFATSLKSDLIANYKGWEQEHFVPSVGMFWQTGMADGMETNINSRQTRDTFAGAPGFRPTLNSYMYADARAISNIAALSGDPAAAKLYAAKAASLKSKVQTMLWDRRRQFFLHMFMQDEQDGIKALTRTYDSGKYAGSEHGREEIGFVPWEFGLPDPGYEAAWKFLMDPNYFYSEFGPTVTERQDPLFLISKNCCVWSGQSWPYATTQTLAAMSNLLHDYRQPYVTPDDYFKLLKVYTRTQRKNGVPYIAESAHPDTGSWSGSDNFNHSEHYFHSGYCDLILTGLVGLRPRADQRIEVAPLAPKSWNWFAVDNLTYHGHRLAILWDRDGTRYRRGRGLRLYIDGAFAAVRPGLTRLVANLNTRAHRVAAPVVPEERRINYAVNNEGAYFPRMSASHTDAGTQLNRVNDGNYWYEPSPPNRWSSRGSANGAEWCSVDFGIERPIQQVKLYLLDDGKGVEAPTKVVLECWRDGAWRAIPNAQLPGGAPVGHRPFTVTFPTLATSKLRALLTRRPGAGVGLTEFEAWGPGKLPLAAPKAAVANIALNVKGEGYPKASASFTSQFDRIEELNDGKSFFSINSRNRWTAYGSPNRTDWVQIDFGVEKRVATLLLHIWGDGGGVQAPTRYDVQFWANNAWQSAETVTKEPVEPLAGAVNVVTIKPVFTSKVRVVFTHRKPSFSGLTELEIAGN